MQKPFAKPEVVLSVMLVALGCACASDKGYVHFLVDPEIEVAEQLKPAPQDRQLEVKSGPATPPIVVNWNDGQTYAEVAIPVLSSGQRVFIQHQKRPAKGSDVGPEVIAPAPSRGDRAHQELLAAYKAKGLPENSRARAVSLAKTRTVIEAEIRKGQYPLAMSYVEQVLARYPAHPEFLRARGSLFLLMGEQVKAIAAYEKAQDQEFDPSVERKLKELNTIIR